MNVSEHPIDREEVMAYLDGELPASRTAVVAAHLEQCAGCRALAADLREVSRQMAAWHVEPAPAAIDAVRLSVVQQPGPPDSAASSHVLRPVQWRVPRWAMVSAGAAAVLVLMVVTSTTRLPRTAGTDVSPSAVMVSPRVGRTAMVSAAEQGAVDGQPQSQPAAVTPIVAPMMARTATLQVMVDDVESARASLDRLLRERQGYMS
jgi:anti-sigma factor RsiW